MITVLQRPLGFILGDCIEANINEAYAGYATVNKSGHGLIDGDYVYITSNVESYNGFWYVNIEDGNKFKIRQYATADDQAYVVDADIEYCEVDSTHGVSCVHLPITYKLRSDLFPTNEVDTATTVTSFNNDSGYVNVNLAGSTISAAPFEFITIGDTVYQVIEYVSSTSYTIALAYDSTLNLVGQSVNKYYNNYNIVVRVYGGLDPAHAWATKKPYELLGTLNLVPDSNNEVFFSISELLKSQIRINNNLLIDTFPNNIDAFTQFYISYAESYDDSLGTNYALGTYTSSFTEDSFEGMAVNAKLPFKNIHSGHLTDYIMNRATAKFLTLFTIPILSGCYHDITFIVPDNLNADSLSINGVSLPGDPGVYKAQINTAGLYTLEMTSVNQLTNPTFNSNIDNWDNVGSGETWVYNAFPGAAEVTVTGSQNSKRLQQAYKTVSGASYAYDFEIIVSSLGADVFNISMAVVDESGNVIQTIRQAGVTNGTVQLTGTFTANQNGNYIGFRVITVTP